MEATFRDENNDTLRQALVDRLKNQGVIRTSQVEEAFRAVPRHMFVPEADSATAYNDTHIVTRRQDDLPISSCSQPQYIGAYLSDTSLWQDDLPISSCSQPSITAIMLEMLDLQPGQRVLEIGAGTGYAAALMAHLVGETGQVTLDLDEDIVNDAHAHLKAAGIDHVQVICGDGALGWEEATPYDRVVLTVGASDIAPAWREQLRPGGRMVLPLQFTPFQSEIATIPMPPDQFLLALDRGDTCLESVDIRACYFMTLRGASAAVPTGPIALGPVSGLACIAADTIDRDTAFRALNSAPQDEVMGTPVAFAELWGLRLWLALREPHFCELYAKGEATRESSFPSLLRIADTFIVTIGLYESETWSLLSLEEDTTPAKDHRRPFKLTVRRFGPERALTQRLQEQVTAWESAGHPFVWSAQGTMEGMHIRACPLETDYIPQAHETLLKKRWTQFAFTPQMNDPENTTAEI